MEFSFADFFRRKAGKREIFITNGIVNGLLSPFSCRASSKTDYAEKRLYKEKNSLSNSFTDVVVQMMSEREENEKRTRLS